MQADGLSTSRGRFRTHCNLVASGTDRRFACQPGLLSSGFAGSPRHRNSGRARPADRTSGGRGSPAIFGVQTMEHDDVGKDPFAGLEFPGPRPQKPAIADGEGIAVDLVHGGDFGQGLLVGPG